jgi:hypothetical protein
MGLVSELKRRNVIRVAIAYAVVAWLLLQVADVVLNNIEAPAWVFQAILLLLVIGFPLALVFAWAFEVTPAGLKRDEDAAEAKTDGGARVRKIDVVILAALIAADQNNKILGAHRMAKYQLQCPKVQS